MPNTHFNSLSLPLSFLPSRLAFNERHAEKAEVRASQQSKEQRNSDWFAKMADSVGDAAGKMIDAGLAHAEDALDAGKKGVKKAAEVAERMAATDYAKKIDACISDPSKTSGLIDLYLMLQGFLESYEEGDSVLVGEMTSREFETLGVPSCGLFNTDVLGYQILCNSYNMKINEDQTCGPQTIEAFLDLIAVTLDESGSNWRMRAAGGRKERVTDAWDEAPADSEELQVLSRRVDEANKEYNRQYYENLGFDDSEPVQIIKELNNFGVIIEQPEEVDWRNISDLKSRLERQIGSSIDCETLVREYVEREEMTDEEKKMKIKLENGEFTEASRLMVAAKLGDDFDLGHATKIAQRFHAIWDKWPSVNSLAIRYRKGNEQGMLPKDLTEAKKIAAERAKAEA